MRDVRRRLDRARSSAPEVILRCRIIAPRLEDAVLTRRELLCRSGMGMGALALGGLLAEAGLLGRSARGRTATATPSAGCRSARSAVNPALAQGFAAAGQGEAGGPPVHERRAVARRHLRPQADARPVPRQAGADQPAHRAQDRRGAWARRSSSRSTARAASRSATCSRTPPR